MCAASRSRGVLKAAATAAAAATATAASSSNNNTEGVRAASSNSGVCLDRRSQGRRRSTERYERKGGEEEGWRKVRRGE